MRLPILHVSSAHRVDDVRLYHKQARALVEGGYDVTILAHSEGEFVRNGVKMRPVPKAGTRFKRMLLLPFWIFASAVRSDARAIHFHDPELIPVGMCLALLGRFVIYDAHEDLPKQILTKPWLPSISRRAVSLACSLIEAAAAKILPLVVTATPSIARHFPAGKTLVVQNMPRLDEFSFNEASEPVPRPHVTFIYTGVLTDLRGAKEMLDALALTPQSYRLVIVGKISPPSLQEALHRHPAAARTEFVEWCSREEVAAHLRRAHAGLVLFHPAPNHVDAQPNKLFEYMAAGLPVIASNFPLWRSVVETNRCGLTVNPLSASEIAGAMKALAEDLAEAREKGRRGISAIRSCYNWEQESKVLLRGYRHYVSAAPLQIV